MGEGSLPQASEYIQTLTTQFTTLAGDLGTWFTQMLPILMSVVGVFILVWLARLGVRLLKSMGNASK